MNKRVVVTGMAGLSPIGSDWEVVRMNLRAKNSGVRIMPDWKMYKGLRTLLGAEIEDFEIPDYYPRKKIRSMGRVALLATRATELALKDAGLEDSHLVTDGSMGIAYGSGTGSPPALKTYAESMMINHQLKGIRATTYIQMMSHTCAANLGQFFEIKGRIIPTCSACTSGSQGIGYSYESIKFGKQNLMVAGGAEEFSVTEAAMFDVLYATSTMNETPKETPRPFDKDRDGLVIGEGAGTFILEDLETARSHDAKIYAEVVGYGANSDGYHITNPSAKGMQRVIEMALEDANLKPEDIGYVNAHGTATEAGDIAESIATNRVFGKNIPISSLKSYMGHTLGACGALECWMTIQMMREGWFAPTTNLKEVDSRCEALDYLMDDCRELQTNYVMSNNFAFGGINTSLIFKRWEE